MATPALRSFALTGRIVVASALALFGATVSAAAPAGVPVAHAAPPAPALTDDIMGFGEGSQAANLTVSGTKLFFTANDGIHGEELWVAEGASAPAKVNDIDPTPERGSNPSNLTVIGGTLWFAADNGTNGTELWRSDGTGGGTVMVADINPGSGDSIPGDFVAFDGDVFFTASTPAEGRELWRTDGTGPGTVLVSDLRPGTASSSPAELTVISYPAPVGDRLWLTAETTSGSSAGERELMSIDGGGVVDPVNTELTDRAPRELVAIGDELYVVAEPADGGPGFQATTIHRTVATGVGPPADFTTTSLTGTSPFNLAAFGTTLFFVDQPPATGQELHRLVGDVSTLVADVRPGSIGSSPSSFVADGTALYFVADDGVTGLELWQFGGGATTQVADLDPGAGSSFPTELRLGPGGRLVFSARTPAAGREPWVYTGAGAPTILEDLMPGPADSAPSEFDVVPGIGLAFAASDPTVGLEVMRLAAPFTIGTVSPLADIRTGTTDSFPSDVGPAGRMIMWGAHDEVVGDEPHVYDPGDQTTTLLEDIAPGTAGSSPFGVTGLGPISVFFADDGTTGAELWRTDGTPDGTNLVEEIRPGPIGSNADIPVAWNGVAYFSAADESGEGNELWRSDGTAPGTFLLKVINPGASGSDVNRFTAMGSHLYMVATTPAGDELWRTDGTGNGTVAVDTAPDRPLQVDEPVALPGVVIFVALDPVSGEEVLWRSDGTAAGTVPIQDLNGTHAAFPHALIVSGSRVFFFAESSADGDIALWSTDGTADGTVELGVAGGFIQVGDMAATPSGVAFAADNGTSGMELWSSNGTPAGTGLIADLVVLGGSEPSNHIALNGWVYFTASTVLEGRELWRTDGTAAGTEAIAPLIPGVASGLGTLDMWSVNDHLMFTGRTLTTGEELWSVGDVPASPAVPGAPTATAAAASAIVSWTAAADVPFAPITGYSVTASPGGATCTTTGALNCTVNGLTPGVSYTFTLRATNRIGSSGFSAPSNAVVPAAAPDAPDAPAAPTATAGSLAATVTWAAVTDPVNAPVTGYTVTASPGGATCATSGGLTCTVPGLAAGTPYTFTVVATNAIGPSAASPPSNTVVPLAPAIVTLTPARVLETRIGDELATVDGQFQGIGRRSAGTTLELRVADRAGVPADAAAVMVNVTAVAPAAAGFVTVFPCGDDRPNASSVNYQAAQVVPNAVLARIGAGGRICLFTTAATDLLVDVNGYVPAGGSPATVVPARLLETRAGPDLMTVDRQFQGIGRQPAGGTVELTVAGRGGVPSNATAVMLNVTAVAPDAPGFLTVYPCGQDRPNASSVNYQAGQVVPNAVLAPVGANGAVCVFSTAAVHLLVDVNGFVPAGSAPTPVVPARLLETRSGPALTTVDRQFEGIGRQPAGSVVELLVAGRGNVPAGASAVMVNVTAVGPDASGFLTVFPCGQPQPGASSVNYQAGQVVPNAVLAKVGSGGRICIFTLADADLLVDVTAWT